MAILGKRTINLVWRAFCIALLVLAIIHCAPVVQAQADNSCLRIERQQLGDPRIPAWILEAEQAECKAANLEAAERGISLEQVLEEIRERDAWKREWQEQREEEWAEAGGRRAAILTMTGAFAVGFIVIAFKRRHRVAQVASRWWWGRGKEFRAWAFGSLFWGIGAFLYVWLACPSEYGSLTYMSDDEARQMFSILIVPPLFFGALWFGYKRFVK